MIQKYRKTDAKVRAAAQNHWRAAKTDRRQANYVRPAPFDPIAYTAALEVLG